MNKKTILKQLNVSQASLLQDEVSEASMSDINFDDVPSITPWETMDDHAERFIFYNQREQQQLRQEAFRTFKDLPRELIPFSMYSGKSLDEIIRETHKFAQYIYPNNVLMQTKIIHSIFMRSIIVTDIYPYRKYHFIHSKITLFDFYRMQTIKIKGFYMVKFNELELASGKQSAIIKASMMLEKHHQNSKYDISLYITRGLEIESGIKSLHLLQIMDICGKKLRFDGINTKTQIGNVCLNWNKNSNCSYIKGCYWMHCKNTLRFINIIYIHILLYTLTTIKQTIYIQKESISKTKAKESISKITENDS